MGLRPFHIAIAVRDLAEARAFYGGLLNCPEGRSDSTWVDFNLFGHQFVCHLNDGSEIKPLAMSHVDGKSVAIPHYGVVLEWNVWESLAERLNSADVQFVLDPVIRFQGQPGEQATFFVADPSGNVLEFKAMRDDKLLFAS